MAEAIRVLHVFGATNLGGAESRVMDLYRTIDKSKVQFDFVVHTAKECYFDKEIIEMGGRIFRVPPFRVYNIFSYKRAFRELFEEHPEFKAVHGHMTSTASIYLPIAKKAGIRTTIAHARSAGVDKGIKGWITKFLRRNLYKKADVLLACSKLAGEAVFGTKRVDEGLVKLLPNTIQSDKYRYNEQVRQQIRAEYDVEDKLVIGHVGRFHPAKNHGFLIDVFSIIYKHNKKAVLFLLGEGELMKTVQEKVAGLGLENQVFFLGNRDKIETFYQAFDVFVFPSFYEGMPGSVVEAQAAGVPCFVSDRVTSEVAFTELVTFMDISETAEKWAEEIILHSSETNRDRYNETAKAGFDVKQQANTLQKFYETGLMEELR